MAISIFRISILLILSCIGLIGLFCEPMNDSANWLTVFILSKGIAAICLYGCFRLYSRWAKSDKWIASFDRWSSLNEEAEK